MRIDIYTSVLSLFILLFGQVSKTNAQLSGCYDPTNWTLNTQNTNGSVTLNGAMSSMDFVADGDNQGVSGLTMPGGIPFNCDTTDGIVSACVVIATSGNISFSWSYFLNFEQASAEPFGFCINDNNFVALTTGSGMGAQSGTAQIPVLTGDTFCIVLASYFSELSQATTAVTNFTGTSCMNAFSVSLLSSSNTVCHGDSVALISSSVVGGTLPYSYLWSNGDTTTELVNVAPGMYCLTVTDSTGDTTSGCTTVMEADSLELSAVQTVGVSCFGESDGIATATASGGTPSYTYLWNNAATTSQATGLIAGNYLVTATDGIGCTASTQVSITEPAALSLSPTVDQNVSCFGGSDGQASVIVSGGTFPYMYEWTSGEQFSLALALSGGLQAVTVTDANGCEDTSQVTLTEPTAIMLTTSSTPETNDDEDGTATVSASGGTPPYVYQWSTTPVQTATTAMSLDSGTYMITVTDDYGCEHEASVLVAHIDSIPDTINGISELGFIRNVTVFPNPSNGIVNISCHLQNRSDIQVQIFNNIGQVIFRDVFSDVTSIDKSIDLSDRSPGVYLLRIASDEEQVFIKIVRTGGK